MKSFRNIFLFFISIFYGTTSNAQQEEYTAYLEQAINALTANDEKNFITNLNYFSVAIEKNKITPETLSKQNFELYSKCLFEASTANISLPNNIAAPVVPFLNYKIEEYPDNMFSLGFLYANGHGVKIDYKKAIHWFEKAADREHSDAMNYLGFLYYFGLGIEKDYSQAEFWFKKGAEKENLNAIYGLALLYRKLDNYTEATYWYKKGCELGDHAACENYEQIKNKK